MCSHEIINKTDEGWTCLSCPEKFYPNSMVEHDVEVAATFMSEVVLGILARVGGTPADADAVIAEKEPFFFGQQTQEATP